MEDSVKRPLILLRMTVVPEYEDEFNAWYRDVHVPHIMKAFLVSSGKRFVSVDDHPKNYLTIYEFLNDTNLERTKEYQKDQTRPEKEDWDKWQARCVTSLERFYCEQIFPDAPVNLFHNSGAIHTVDLKLKPEVSAEQEREFNHWYHADHIPLLLRLFPDFIAAKRYCSAAGTEKTYLTLYGSPTEESMRKIEETLHRPGREGRADWDRWEKACVKEIRRGFYEQIYP